MLEINKGKETPENPDTTVNTDVNTDKSVEDIKAEAEKLEAENKTLGENAKTEEIKSDQLKRLENAKKRNEALKGNTDEEVVEVKTDTKATDELSADDTYTLREKGFAKDSDEAKVLKKYKDAGIITDYQTGLETPGLKAEIEAFTAERTAAKVLNENGDEDVDLNTRKDIKAKHESNNGEVPTDPGQQKDLARDVIGGMDL